MKLRVGDRVKFKNLPGYEDYAPLYKGVLKVELVKNSSEPYPTVYRNNGRESGIGYWGRGIDQVFERVSIMRRKSSRVSLP